MHFKLNFQSDIYFGKSSKLNAFGIAIVLSVTVNCFFLFVLDTLCMCLCTMSTIHFSKISLYLHNKYNDMYVCEPTAMCCTMLKIKRIHRTLNA